jgi:signal transduction histidine kinase
MLIKKSIYHAFRPMEEHVSTKRLVLVYILIAILWVVFSNLYLPEMVSHKYSRVHIYETCADLIFLLTSICIFYVFIRRDIANRQRLTAEILRTQDLERRRISRELHDDLGQSLLALKLDLSKIFSGTKDPKLRDIDDIIDKVRDFSWILSPPQLDDIGLPAALNSLFDRIRKTNNNIIITSNNISEIKDCFSAESSLNIFRVFQEIMTNIVRYANASSVNVSIVKKNDHALFRVQDDGVGFNPKELSLGVGLSSIKERIASMHGKLKIVAQKGAGTIITFQIPIGDH